MRALWQRIQRWSPQLETLAFVAAFAYLSLFIVSPLKWQTETNSTIPAGWWIANHLYSANVLDTSKYVGIKNFFFTAFGLLPVVGLYGLQVRAALRGDTRGLTLRTVLTYAAIYLASMLFITRTLSSDIFSYIAYGRLQTVHHANPFVDAPADHPDAMLHLIAYAPFTWVVSAYGPVWLMVSRVISLAAGAFGDVAWHYELAYKLFAASCHLGCSALVWAVLGKIRPSHRTLGTVVFAWNPLMIAENSWNAHNDSFVLLLVLAAVWAQSHKRSVLATVFLALSVPVKWITAILVPLYVLADAREAKSVAEMLRRALRSCFIGAAIIAATMVPYWHGQAIPIAMNDAPGNHFTSNSLGDLVLQELRWVDFKHRHPEWDPEHADRTPHSPNTLVTDSYAPMIEARRETHRLDWRLMPERAYGGLERAMRLLANVFLLGVIIDRLRRTRDIHSMLNGWGWIFFTYVTVCAFWFWPWYLVWFCGVAVLTGWGRLGKTAAILGISGSMTYFSGLFGGWAFEVRALFTFLPPFTYLAWTTWEARRARSLAGRGGDSSETLATE